MIDGKRTVEHPSYRQRTGYHSMLVGGMALLASAILVIGNNSTKDAILLRHAEDVQKMLNEVIPASFYDNNLLEDKITIAGKEVFQARIEETVMAVAFQTEAPGYSGIITAIMAVDSAGKILGVRVVSHTETPGLGDKIEKSRSPWILSFDDMTLNPRNDQLWAVKKDGGKFDQFSGATITPRAVVHAVKQGMLFFNQHRNELLASNTVADANEEQNNGK